LQIIPFRGQYFGLRAEARHLVKGLIYPLANPKLPFLGVHLTRTAKGEVLVGPNAVLAFKREGYHPGDIKLGDVFDWITYRGFWKLILANLGTGLGEILKAWSLTAFTRAMQRLVPGIRAVDLQPARAGVRAQAVDANGKLVDDFRFAQSEKWFHVLNAPSPAATACFAIGEWIAEQIDFSMN
jgi:L-2-hydroxyglutarate oxidase